MAAPEVTTPAEAPLIDTELTSGARLVVEHMPEVASVAIGCWVGIGSRDEPDEMSGASHFLEHLLFKGTERYSSLELAEEVDARGGEMNAFTSKEHTAYFLRLPADELAWGVDVLGDVLAHPMLDPDDVDAERQVILEELAMSLDDPEDRIHTLLLESVFPDHPLGREVLGDADRVMDMSAASLRAFHEADYGAANLVVAVAGHVMPEEVHSLVSSSITGTNGRVLLDRVPPGAAVRPLLVERRPVEQAHVAIGWRGLAFDDDDRYALAIANQVLGGGPSSRLFQEVRENRGLAYSVYSTTSALTDTGTFSLYVATGLERTAETLRVIEGLVDDLCSTGVTSRELEVAQGYLVGSLLLGLEDSGSRMARIGASAANREELLSVADHVGRIRSVATADVARVIGRVLEAPRALVGVGPFDDDHPAFASALCG